MCFAFKLEDVWVDMTPGKLERVRLLVEFGDHGELTGEMPRRIVGGEDGPILKRRADGWWSRRRWVEELRQRWQHGWARLAEAAKKSLGPG